MNCGFSRNLFHQFVSMRNQRFPTQSNLNFQIADSAADQSQNRLINSIENELQKIEGLISDLKAKQDNMLKVNFEDNQSLQANQDALTNTISREFKNAKDLIISLSPKDDKTSVLGSLKIGYLSRLSSLVDDFHESQIKYMQKAEKRNQQIEGQEDVDIDADAIDDIDSWNPGFNSQQVQEIQELTKAINQQRQGRQELLRSITSLNEVQVEFRTLIYEQGTILDRIDKTYQESVEKIESGANDLHHANQDQKKANKCYYFVLIALCLVIFICGIYCIAVKENRRKKLHENDNRSNTTATLLDVII